MNWLQRKVSFWLLPTPGPQPHSPALCSRPWLGFPSALQTLRGWKDVTDEMEEIRKEDEAEKAAGFISVWKLFKMQSLRWQLISVIVLMAGQQLSGVNAVRATCELGGRSVCYQAPGMTPAHISEGLGNGGLLAILHLRHSPTPHGSLPDLLLR